MSVVINHPAPTEGVHHIEQNVTVYFKEKDLGKGTLYIAESVLCWVSTSGQGYALPYSSICIHAVCKDLTHFPKECIYLNVDGRISLEEAEQNEGGDQNEISSTIENLSVTENGEENNVEDDYEPVVEIRFGPDNTNMLDVMFQAISDCQALNPDPNEKSDDVKFSTPQSSLVLVEKSAEKMKETETEKGKKSDVERTPKKKNPANEEKLRPIALHGSNIAREYGKQTNTYAVRGIEVAVEEFARRGHTKILAFVPRFRVNGDEDQYPTVGKEILERLDSEGRLAITPSRYIRGERIVCSEERALLEYAEHEGGVVITNDLFRDFLEKREFVDVICNRCLGFEFKNDSFSILPRGGDKERGELIENVLRF